MIRKAITSFRDEHAFLSNFYDHPIEYKGKMWPTSEHAYQAMKSPYEHEQEWVREQGTPGKAKRAGQKIHLRDDWEEMKVPVMREILEIKFEDPELKQMLLDTGDARLVEGNAWHDVFWGMCDGKGKNWLGRLLMEIRDSHRGPTLVDMFSGD